jgi:7-cyano-7-deazaguanine synthase
MVNNTNNTKTVVNILWTGGWDSTYRIIQLIEKDIIIQPFYLMDNRKSEQLELSAIKLITQKIRNEYSVPGTINDVKLIAVSDIEKSDKITKAYKSLYEKVFFGIQYEWLARFSKTNKNIELIIHQDDKAITVIKAFGDIKKVNDKEKGEYYVLDTSKSSEELSELFGNFHFPLLKYTKLIMKKEAEKLGFIDIMNETWFCHRPINELPCGLCNPCKYTIEEGMGYRLPRKALRRYKTKKMFKSLKIEFIYIVYRKIRGWN